MPKEVVKTYFENAECAASFENFEKKEEAMWGVSSKNFLKARLR